MDGVGEGRCASASRPQTSERRRIGTMKGKGKTGAKPGKQKHTVKGANRAEVASTAQSSNSFGKPSSIHPFRAGQNFAAGLRDEDWKFREFVNEPRRIALVAACWYEYSRESKHVRRTMRKWLLSENLTARFQGEMEKICRERKAKKEPMWPRGNGKAAEPPSPARSRRPPDPIPVSKSNHQFWGKWWMPDYALARHRLLPQRLWPLAKAWLTVHDSGEDVDTIEWGAAKDGAPRLRELAEHLAKDTPWLLIPQADRERAIANRFRDRREVPKSADGVEHFPIRPAAFESLGWNCAPQFSEEEIWRDEDIYHREIDRERGFEIVPVRIGWRFTDHEIREDVERWLTLMLAIRPNERKENATARGGGKNDEWYAALKNLAAMRLISAFPPREAFKKFRHFYMPTLGLEFEDEKGTAERNFRQRAADARKAAATFVPSGECAYRAETWTARQRRLQQTTGNSATMI
ncbi:hypothetical protein BH20VER3_BH20VER3_19050 [soil metagenome]